MRHGVADVVKSLPTSHPIHRVFQDLDGTTAGFTLKGTTAQNRHFSFERPPRSDPTNISAQFGTNLRSLEQVLDFDSQNLTLPNGAWPHSGQAIKAEDYTWVENSRSKTIVPVSTDNQPVTYDAIATSSTRFVLAAQGADCPSVFLCDPRSQVVGIAHAGWKPLVRGVIPNIIKAMVDLGATPRNIKAYISPGAGDRSNVFTWDEQMEPHVREVFVEADRTDLLHDLSIRHPLTHQERFQLSTVVAQDIPEGATSFKLSELANIELKRCGISRQNISRSSASTILDRYPSLSKEAPQAFKYHSYRRERPHHGLNMSIIFLKHEYRDHL